MLQLEFMIISDYDGGKFIGFRLENFRFMMDHSYTHLSIFLYIDSTRAIAHIFE